MSRRALHLRSARRAALGASLLLVLAAFQAQAEAPARTGGAAPAMPAPPSQQAARAMDAVATAEAENIVVRLREVRFRGNTVVPSAELAAIAAPYLQRDVDADALEQLRQELTQRYVGSGYVNSGALYAEDAIRGDVLTVDLVEGRLEAIQLRGMGGLRDAYLLERLAPDMAQPFNYDRLRERFALLLDDPLFERLNARLLPGSEAGQAVLDVEVARAREVRLSVLANNYRPPSIGSEGYGLAGSLRNLTGHGDLLEAGLQGAARHGGSPRTSLSWQVPLNHRGTQLTLQAERGQSAVLEEPLRTLDIRSILTSREIGLRQVLSENLRHRLAAGLSRVERRNETTLLGEPYSFTPGEPDGRTEVSAWRFWQEATLRGEQQMLALRSTFTRARNNLQPGEELPATATQPRRSYTVWLGQAQYARQVLDGAQVVVRSTVQRAGGSLVALDRMAIGGAATVRGYRENQLVRDQGLVVNLELDYPLALRSPQGLQWSLLPFYDYGRGRNRGEAGQTITSAGLAMRARWNGFSLDLALARRLSHPDFDPAGRRTLQDRGVHLQLAYQVL